MAKYNQPNTQLHNFLNFHCLSIWLLYPSSPVSLSSCLIVLKSCLIKEKTQSKNLQIKVTEEVTFRDCPNLEREGKFVAVCSCRLLIKRDNGKIKKRRQRNKLKIFMNSMRRIVPTCLVICRFTKANRAIFNPHSVLVGTFSTVLSHFTMKIHLGESSPHNIDRLYINLGKAAPCNHSFNHQDACLPCNRIIHSLVDSW